MIQNLRYALRSLLRTPSFTVAALLCLALGIGATTAIFSIVNAVVLRPLPYKDSDRLIRLYTEFPDFPNGGLKRFWVSTPEYFDLKAAKSFEELGAWSMGGANLAGAAESVRITSTAITASGMKLLGQAPLLGRLISPEDDLPGAPQVLVLSYGLWQKAFGADPHIVGKTTYINNSISTVIGVMPKGFMFPPGETEQSEAWVPAQLNPQDNNRSNHYWSLLGRLRPSTTLIQARNEMQQLMTRWGENASPNYHELNPKNHPVVMYPFYDEVVGGVRKAMMLLLGAVIFVLLIACVNVANLLLARSEGRQREIAVRRAMGASTSHLLKQFILEGTFLSLIGGAVGLLIANASLALIEATNTGSIPRADEISLDWRVLAFTLAISILTGIFFGLAPLVQISALRVYETLKAVSGRTAGSLAANQFRRLLVVSEIAMAFTLIAGAGLMVRGFWKLQQVQAGLNPNGLLTFRISLPDSTYKDATQKKNFWRTVQARIAQVPGVQSVTTTAGLPPVRGVNQNDTEIEDFVPTPVAPIQNITFWQTVGDRFFETMGIRFMEGRPLDSRDNNEKAPGAVINHTMARTFWPGQSPIGRRVRPDSNGPWYTVVGVIADVKNAGVDKPVGTEIFFPLQQAPSGFGTSHRYVIVKTTSNPKALTTSIRKTIASLDPSLPLARVRTMDEVMEAAQSRPRFLTLILTMFSALALTLATVGIYGVISYSVAQRTAEFGIKMALGAQPGQLLRQVLWQGLLLGFIGIGAGIVGAALVTRSLEGLIFGVSSMDFTAFTITAIILTIATLIACYMPAARAMRVEPIEALRYE